MILRLLFPVCSLLLAGFSILTESDSHAPDSTLCRWGGCRFAQMYDAVNAHGIDENGLKALLVQDASNPDQWCSQAEYFRSKGKRAEAKLAYDRAIELSPGLAPVRMRAANFYFANGYREEGLRQAAAILSNTVEYDELLFSYVLASEKPLAELLGTALPAQARPAHSWLGWLVTQEETDRHKTVSQVAETWDWMQRHQLLDEPSATRTVSILWQRQRYGVAQRLWAQWLPSPNASGQMLANPLFQKEPAPVPFDWNLQPAASVEFIRKDGLEVRFLGKDNIDFRGARQSVVLSPGRYRFSAAVSAEGITTDEGVAIQIADAENGARLSVQSKPILGTLKRSPIDLEFKVGPSTPAITVQMVRKPSLKFDSKIAGSLHIYSTSLVRDGAN